MTKKAKSPAKKKKLVVKVSGEQASKLTRSASLTDMVTGG